VSELLDLFPGLTRGGHAITSARSQNYNCIAWAAGDSQRWWWPGPPEAPEPYWPTGVARDETLAAFRAAFASLGYAECDSSEPENGF